MAKRPTPIPNLTDDDLRQRLRPLAEKVLPETSQFSPGTLKKNKRKGIEFMLPEAVILALKTRAAQRGVSATVLMLEVLRDAGFPVEPADFIDLR